MENTGFLTKKFLFRAGIIFAVAVFVLTFVKFDYFLNMDTIASVEQVRNTKIDTKTGFDGKYEYEENYYRQEIKAQIKNGVHKGKTVFLENECTGSGVYDLTYRKGDCLLYTSRCV